MTNWVLLPLYFVVSLVGGLVGYKLKIPAGTLIGAMVAIILFKLIIKSDWIMPKQFGFLLQVLIGLLVGASFQISMLPLYQKLLIPVFISSIVLVGTGVLTAIVISKTGLLDMETSYIGTSPGAMSVLITLAADSNINAAVVTCFHLFRVFFVVITAPIILKFIVLFK